MPLKISEDHLDLWNTVTINPGTEKELKIINERITNGVDAYIFVGNKLGIPWEIVAVTHEMEADCNFGKHLHNGDPLSARTVHVPKGRPKEDPENGGTTYTWSESAIDAFNYQAQVRSIALSFIKWNPEGTLGWLEAWNGYGYRKKGINTPYLWSGTNHYSSGLFVADGKYNPDAKSKQVGCVPILKTIGFTPV